VDPQFYRRANEIFQALCDEPAGELPDLLARHCGGDPELRRIVEAMLEADRASAALVDHVPAEGVGLLLAGDLTAAGPASSADEPLPERIGPYRVVGRLGAGGMGVVYEAEQTLPRRHVAVKCLHPWLRTPCMEEHFRFEVEAMGRLLHPGIPQVYEAGLDGDRLYLVMERVEGERIDRFVERRQLGLAERVRLLAAVGDAVEHAHRRGVVHRDLKPGNILVDDGGQPKVLDFGIAAAARQAAAAAGPALGTPAYMSPEQLRGDAVDARSDVFALGVVAWQVLTGRLPFGEALRDRAAAARRIERGPEPLGLERSLLSRDLEAILRHALAPDPARRCPDAAAWSADLRAALAGRPIRARPEALPGRTVRAVARHRGALLATAAAALLAAAGAWWVAARYAAEAAPPAPPVAAATSPPAAPPTSGGPVPPPGPAASGDADLDAAAQAFLLAGTADLRREALRKLARLFRARWNWSSLAAVLASLEPAADDDEIRRLRVDAALARRDLATAAQALPADAPEAALLRSLAHARSLPSTAERFWSADLDGDGRSEALGLDRRRHVVAVFDPHDGLRLRGVLRLPADRPAPVGLWVLPWQPPLLLIQHLAQDGTHGTVCAYVVAPDALDGAPLTPVWEWPEDALLAVADADLDGDGTLEVYLGTGPYSRALWRVVGSDPASWSLTHPDPEIDALASDVTALSIADLDGDGRPELAVALGPWQAYEVRVLDAVPGGGLRSLARWRLGVVTSLAPVPGTAAAVLTAVSVERYANPRLFGEQQPFAALPGVYRLGLGPGGSSLEGPVPLPSRAAPPATADWRLVGEADLGVGVADDLLLTGELDRQQYALLQPTGGEARAGLLLGGTALLAAFELDGDPWPELVVQLADRDSRDLILGIGDEPIPLWENALPPASGPPEALARSPRWSGAATLMAMGLSEQAARFLEAQALDATDPQEVEAALRWSALLWDDLDRPEQALAASDRALAREPQQVEVLGVRARALERLHRFAEAVAAWDAALAAASPGSPAAAQARGERERLRPQAAPIPTVDLRFDRPLDPAWRILEPLSVRRVRARSELQLDTYSGEGAVAELPLTLEGGRLVIEVELQVTHAEMASGFSLGIRSRADPEAARLVLQFGYSGGGGITDRTLLCRGPGRYGALELVQRIDPADYRESVTARLAFRSEPAEAECEVGIGEAAPSRAREVYDYRLPPGEYVLVLDARGDPNYGTPMWAAAAVRRLRIEGARLAPDPAPDSLSVARARLANGDPEAALAGLPDTQPVDRALALALLGRIDDAADAAAEAVRRGDPRVPFLLRRTDALLADALFSRLGPEFFELYVAAWRSCLEHPDHVDGARSLSAPVFADIPGDTPAQRELLQFHARVAFEQGLEDTADRDLERLLQRAAPGEQSNVAEACFLGARVARSRGDTAAARERIDRFVAASPSADLAWDRVRAEPTLSDLAPAPEAGAE
jgi:tetratricopeptide (TPR) repeat protein